MRNAYKIFSQKPERTTCDTYGRIILKLVFLRNRVCVVVNWISMTRNRVHWRDFVNVVMNVRVP
jgi:hypothetical protein